MNHASQVWALILAAGDGKRLRGLTTLANGTSIPKQFCSLHEGPSLMHEALLRARTVTSDAHTCVVVAEQHRRWWEPELWSLPMTNVIVQSENRGTAHGILLPLLHIAERDPAARILILPSDHFVYDDAALTRSLRQALERLNTHRNETVLLGIEPGHCDPDLGYIIPSSEDDNGIFKVRQFIEKPSPLEARELLEHGALWNSFIIASTAQALFGLFERRIRETVKAMRTVLRSEAREPDSAFAMAALYDRLGPMDFSRDILQGQEVQLGVLRVPRCGWSDLGTPERVANVLHLPPPQGARDAQPGATGPLSLAIQYDRTTSGMASMKAV